MGLLGFAALAAEGAPLLDDGPGGMTCYEYAAAANLRWQNKGGDWVDESGMPQGEKPFAEVGVVFRQGRQVLSLDVTNLAKRWQEGLKPAGAVLLRNVAADATGIVNLRSREGAIPLDAPQLEIEWSDGTRERIDADADTSLACPTRASSGRSKIMKVGDGQAAAIVFDLPTRRDRLLRRVTLRLVAERVYRTPLVIGVYQLTPPASWPSELRQGLAQGFRNDIGIERHRDVLFADRFEPGRNAAVWSGSGMSDDRTVASDATNRFEPFDGHALRVTIPQGVNQGLNSHLRFASRSDGEPEEAFFRYYLRFGDSWNPTLDGGKLPGLSGTYGRAGWGMRKSDGSNGWSARGAFFKQAASGSEAFTGLRGIGSYVYLADQKGDSGAVWGWGLGPTGLLEKNRWYSVEQQVKLNRPGNSDGEVRAWLDGHLVFERTGLRFRDVPTLKIESLWMNVYHGGTAKAPADLTLFIDNLVIARRYIGPAGKGP